MQSIHDRIMHIIRAERMSISKFEREIGIGRNAISASLKHNSAIPHTTIESICIKFPKYTPTWLILGKKTTKEMILKSVIKALEDL